MPSADACYVIAVRLLVLAIVLLAAPATRAHADDDEIGWRVSIPDGWTRDAEASKAIVEQVKGAFFAGTPVLVRGDVFRGPDAGLLTITTVETGKVDDPSKILESWSQQAAVRNAGDRLVADYTRGDMRGTVQAAYFEGIQHFVHVACAGPHDACERALGSVGIGDDGEGNNWWYWIAIAGACLVSLGLVGWRIELRRSRSS